MLMTCVLWAGCCLPAAEPAKTPQEALKPFNDLIGEWKGTGRPAARPGERTEGFWTEMIEWSWKFGKGPARLAATFDGSKQFTAATLDYLPESDTYRLTLTTPSKATRVFTGSLVKKTLTLEHTDPETKDQQRLVITLLHANRYLYRYETKPADERDFARQFDVGATKQGVPFASVDNGPICIVTGGVGTMKVMYKGKTYYVCCTGCRDAFNDNPEEFITKADK